MPKPPGRHSRGFLGDALDVIHFVWTHPSNRGRRVRTLLRAFLVQFRGRALGRPTVVPWGQRSRLEIWPERGSSGLAYANPPEWAEFAVWTKVLRRGDLFIDVGANVGAYTIWALELGALVIAIEPNPQAAAQLRRNVDLNLGEVEILQAAAADKGGTVRVTSDLGVLNHIIAEGSDEGIRVPSITLDELIGDRVVAGMKIDVEGAEALVIAGASRALAEKRIRLLQLEWNPQDHANFGAARTDLASSLRSMGYELLRPDDAGNLVPITHDGPGPDIFARPTT
ncbi:MAG: FkbM family methyltransferase [Actinomycetota bacterium]